MTRRQRILLSSAILLCSLTSYRALGQWTQPTPEELSMTSQPQVPGAPAVYLYREETTDDQLHFFSIYVRIKVLTDRGKDYANVELPYTSISGGGGYTVEDIQGRTIHSDGTVIPFTGKPLQKVVEKSGDRKVMTKVFTLPDVEVGSIIEYRYKTREDDQYFRSPDWYIQSELYTRKAHYQWRPTDKQLITEGDGGQLTNTIAWTPVLPAGVEIKQTRLPGTSGHEGQLIMELNLHDIPPAPLEDYMPPIRSFTYRVLFYYTPYRTSAEYWKSQGKRWSKANDKFVGPGSGVSAAVQHLVASGDTQEQKLKKFYAAVMELENTDFTRQHSQSEDKAAGFGQTRNTDDVLQHKRGSSDQLAALFVAMARASGMKAYLMAVTNRDRSLFAPAYLSMNQLDDNIAIVNVDGKEQFFDPGSRYCPYGHLAWKHTYAQGLRQAEGGAVLAVAPGELYKFSHVVRVANLKMDQEGVVTGTVGLKYSGSPALRWRQLALAGDEAGLNRELRTAAERMLPVGMEVKVDAIENYKDYEQPLSITFDVKGAIGSPTGKRLLIPGDLFEGNTQPLFTHEKRELPVYFDYGSFAQDAIRINFPSSFAIESLPKKEVDNLKSLAVYDMSSESTSTSVTIRRNYSLGEIVFPIAEYPELRSFYSKMETKDQEPIVFSRTVADAGQGVTVHP